MRRTLGLVLIGVVVSTVLLGGNALTSRAQYLQIDASANDAEERGNGAFSTVGVSIGLYSHTDNTSINYRCAGFRFEDIPIDQGQCIENAYLELYFLNQVDINVLIFAHDVDDSPDFSTLPSIIDNGSRPKTDNYTEWIENGLSLNSWDNSDNIAAVLQEVVNRPGWENGNAITMLLIAKTDQILSANVRSYDFSTAFGARLHFHWQPTIDGTRYPSTAMPQIVINIRQVLVSHGQDATDITAKLTFDHENFRFMDGYPENTAMTENLNSGESIAAEWYVATPDIEDNYTFNVEWEFIHADYHAELSDNFNIEVRYPLVPTPHTIPVVPLSSDALAAAIVAIGVALGALALSLYRGNKPNGEEGI
jgi:hypothetical protein